MHLTIILRGLGVAVLGAASSAAFPANVFGQSPGRVNVSAAVGLGSNTGNARYDSSFLLSGRFDVGIGLTSRLGFETGVHKTWNLVSGSDDAVAVPPGGHLPVAFWHVGGVASVVFTAKGRGANSRLRLLGGGGIYRISATQLTGQVTPTVTAAGIHLGMEATIKHGRRSEVFVGLRGVYFPDLGGESAWHFPLEIGIRYH